MAVPVRYRCPLLCSLGLVVALVSTAVAQQPADTPEELSPQLRLELFRKESPAARLRLVEKLPRSAEAFHQVTVGKLVASIVERGSLEPAASSDIVCRVKAPSVHTTVASVIKWVIDDGTFVKKGERVLELDSSGLQEQLATQKVAREQAAAARIQAEEDFKLGRKSSQIDVRLGEILVRLAELELKKDDGTDKERHEILALRLEQTRLELERTRALAVAKDKRAEVDLQTRAAIADLETSRLRDVEEQLKLCVMTAPCEGLVIYYVPEQTRFGNPQSIVAQGEPAREGQKVLQICDLKRMLVNTRVHEALVSRVRAGQKAVVRVDAFPNRPLAGAVTQIATIPSQQNFLAADVKVYQTLVALADEVPGLKPGMSAEVRIVQQELAGVVQVPVPAVLRVGRQQVCFVKTTAGIEERPVDTGLNTDFAVEIKKGLQEGDLVLTNPRALLSRLDLRSPRGTPQGQGARQRQATEILVRSVKPPADEADGKRSLVSTYGLTEADLERLGTLKEVTSLVPLRQFPHEVRRLEKSSPVQVVATTPDFVEEAGLTLAVGRFFNEVDGTRLSNFVVLGSAVAKELFPSEEPLDKTILLGRSPGFFYKVVGVLPEQTKGFAGLKGEDLNRAVYIPLATCKARFGDRIVFRRAGSRWIEAVQINTVVVRVAEPEQVRPVAQEIRTMLEKAHKQKDWAVVEPSGR